MTDLGKILIGLGALILVIGLVILLLGRLNVPVGRLPGDFVIRRGAFTFYFPLATSVVLSVLLTLLLMFLRR